MATVGVIYLVVATTQARSFKKGSSNMSDAEATIRQAILSGYASVTGLAYEDEARVDAILECIFAKPVRWAVVVYLKELEE